LDISSKVAGFLSISYEGNGGRKDHEIVMRSVAYATIWCILLERNARALELSLHKEIVFR